MKKDDTQADVCGNATGMDERDVIERALRDYRLTKTCDEDGDYSLGLEDALSTPLDDTVKSGLEEIENLADTLAAVVHDYYKALTPPAPQAESREKVIKAARTFRHNSLTNFDIHEYKKIDPNERTIHQLMADFAIQFAAEREAEIRRGIGLALQEVSRGTMRSFDVLDRRLNDYINNNLLPLPTTAETNAEEVKDGK